jgi:hypothetical protein
MQTNDVAAQMADEIMAMELTDAEFAMIAKAVETRRRQIQQLKFGSLKPGDRVRFVACRPKYLIGRTATVKKVVGDVIYVNGAEVGSKFASQPNLKVKKDMVEVV